MPIHPLELDAFMSRAQTELKKTNRNRPYGPIPAFTMIALGSYDAESESNVILERFSAVLQETGDVAQAAPYTKLAIGHQHAEGELVGSPAASS